jgi:hypothetical protein
MRRPFGMGPMRVLPVLACAAPILTLASVGVSTERNCACLPPSPCFWSAASDSRRGFESVLTPNTSNNRSLRLPTNNPSARRTFGLRRRFRGRRMRKPAERIVEVAKVRITAAGCNALAAED